MITSFVSGATKLWSFNGPPDSSVRDALGIYAAQSELFIDYDNYNLYFCQQGGTVQIWTRLCYLSDAQALVDAIPQADWAQANSAAKDFIKNKPTIPASQVQSDWAQANPALVDFIKNKPNLATVATTGNYNDLNNKPTIPAAQIQSDWAQTNSSSVDFIKNKPAAMSQASASRTLNTIFQVSATRWTQVRYSVDISTTVSLTGSQVGRVVLEMATNAAFTTGVQELQSFGNGNSGTLVVGLVLTQLCTACLSGQVPPGNYVRLRTVNTTGTPTFTYVSGQEVLL